MNMSLTIDTTTRPEPQHQLVERLLDAVKAKSERLRMPGIDGGRQSRE